MKKITKIMALTMAMMMSMSFYAVNASETDKDSKDDLTVSQEIYENEDMYEDEDMWIEFDLEDLLKEDATEEELAEFQALIATIEALEEELDAAYDELFESDLIAEDYDMDKDWEEYTFEDLKEAFKEDVTQAQIIEAEDLFDQAMALEEQGDFDAADQLWDELFDMDIFEWEDWEDEEFTFDMLLEEMKEDLDDATIAEAEVLFEQAIALEEAGKFEEADDLWVQLEEMDLFDWDEDWEDEDFTFDMLQEEMKEDLSGETLKEAEELFNQAIALEEAGEYDEAEDVWIQLEDMDLFDWDDFEDYEDYEDEDFDEEDEDDLDEEDFYDEYDDDFDEEDED